MRGLPVVLLLAFAGCASAPDLENAERSRAPQVDVEIRRLWSRGELSKLRMTNNSNRVVSYLHWAGQGPEPVAYCLRDDGSQWLCSEQIYLEGDESSGYTEWTHDTVLQPHSSVSFRVRAGASTRVGIKAFPAGSVEEVLVWAD
jgi:hypothetical protein